MSKARTPHSISSRSRMAFISAVSSLEVLATATSVSSSRVDKHAALVAVMNSLRRDVGCLPPPLTSWIHKRGEIMQTQCGQRVLSTYGSIKTNTGFHFSKQLHQSNPYAEGATRALYPRVDVPLAFQTLQPFRSLESTASLFLIQLQKHCH